MPYFAAVFTLAASSWSGKEVELDIETLDDVADLLRDNNAGGIAILLAEQDDEWFSVVRLDGDDEPRSFLSDRRVTSASALARGLVDDPGDAETNESPPLQVEPAGDTELLDDLGVSSDTLIALANGEGVLPGDALLQIAERLGFDEILDRMR